MVFFGEYTISVTEGGRVAIPKKIRDLLRGGTCVVTKGFDTCLAGYDASDWEKRSKDLMDVSLLDKEHIDKRRMLFSGAHEISLDDQGRLVIPKSLATYMGLASSKVTIVGVGDHFEIWDNEKWNVYSESVSL